MELKKEELLKIQGGFSFNGTIINALVRGINCILELGRSLGTAIRMVSEKKACPVS